MIGSRIYVEWVMACDMVYISTLLDLKLRLGSLQCGSLFRQ